MAIIEFPPIETADEHGLLAIGGDLEPSSLILAYTSGIFPWPISDEYPLAWFSPDPRGVLYTKSLHIPRSLQKIINKSEYKITINQQFENVIRECQHAPRKDQDGTWITEEIISSYIKLNQLGHAYSIEVLDTNNTLIGGLYGVNIGKYLTGESMFYKKANASKLALVHLLKFMEKEKIPFLDTQMVTETVKNLGGIEIPREVFVNKIRTMINKDEINWPLGL